jgi:hypothetical protein
MAGWVVSLVLAVAVIVLALRLSRERRRRKELQLAATWPIASINLDALDAVFTPGPFGPSRETEITFIGRGPIAVPGGTSDAEAWVLAVLAKRATHLFEFGTCTGKTAYLWSRNAMPGARIVTLTLAPAQHSDYALAEGDTATDARYALDESSFVDFLYSGTAAADAITQLYGDSKQFDASPWHEWADLVFVDGSHARSYVESDSQKAMKMVKPGGLVVWHDYAGEAHAIGVFQALNELAKSLALRHVRGTTFVVWRRPAER